VASHQPPNWPEATVPKQIHLELAVTDLDAVEMRAVQLGAVKSRTHPIPMCGGCSMIRPAIRSASPR
jgi:hypothetical protein